MLELKNSVQLLSELIAYNTISSESNLGVIDYLAKTLRECGARIHLQKNPDGGKANLYASLGPEGPGGILLSGHSDVVPVAGQPWTHDPFEMRQSNERLYGRGTCDMKGFIACCLVLAQNLRDATLNQPLHFAFTYDEEVGCLGAQALADWLAEQPHKPRIAIIGEPTEMRVIEAHKGIVEMNVQFRGLAGHGSAPAAGVNAVEYAARYVANLLSLREELQNRAPADSPFDPPWTTINIGSLTGGVAANVIADQAELEWEFRPVQDSDTKFIKDKASEKQTELTREMQSIDPNSGIQSQILGEVIGLKSAPENQAREICCHLTGNNQTHTAAFATEAGIFQSIGIDAVVCGPGSIAQAHKADEYIELSEMKKCLAFLDALGGIIRA